MARLPTHIEARAVMRAVEAQGDFVAIAAKGDPDGGALLLHVTCRGQSGCIYERVPNIDGSRRFACVKEQGEDSPDIIDQYLARRRNSDPDIWILELDIANQERFAATLLTALD